MHKVHLVWKTVEKISIYGNPDNLLKLLGGHTMQWIGGDNVFVKLSASAVMISMRIMECVKEELYLLKEIRKLYDACFDNTTLSPNLPWAKPGTFIFISPSCTHMLKSVFMGFIKKMIRILKEILLILKQLFILSMKMISAAESFSLDPRVLREGTTEFFINLEKCYKALLENKELLLDFLKDYKIVIEKLLEGLGNIVSYKTLVQKLEEAISDDDESNINKGPTLKKYGTYALQQMLFGLFQGVNMQHLLPRKLIPRLEFDWTVEKETHPRYPPNWVQIFGYEDVVQGWRKERRSKPYVGKSVYFNQL